MGFFKNFQLNFILRSFKQNPFFTSILTLIILSALFFRIYNFHDRLVFVGDNSRDAQIGLYAARNQKIPQIGPFAQAPFFFGPFWYWYIEATYFFPIGLLSPWFITSLLSLIFLGLTYYLGYILRGRLLGIILLALASFSPALISNFFHIWNPTAVPLLVLLSLIFFARYYQKRRLEDLFFLGLSFGLATTIHFQTAITLPILLAAIWVSRNKIKSLGYLLPALFIPFLPFLLFDLSNHFFWSKSFLIYTLIDQPSVNFPNRWLTEMFDFWPNIINQILGTPKLVNYLLVILGTYLLLSKIKKFKKYRILYLLTISFALEIIILRYYKGPRESYYMFFAYPQILVLTAIVIFEIYKLNKLFGVILITTVLAFSTSGSIKQLRDTGVTFSEIKNLQEEIYRSYPNKKLDIFGCEVNPISLSQPLALYVYFDGRNSPNANVKIGVCENYDSLHWQELRENDIKSQKWINRSTQTVYQQNVQWWKENPPQKDTQFWQFIKRKLNPICYPHCP